VLADVEKFSGSSAALWAANATVTVAPGPRKFLEKLSDSLPANLSGIGPRAKTEASAQAGLFIDLRIVNVTNHTSNSAP